MEYNPPVSETETVDLVVKKYLELRKPGFDRAQAKVVIPDLVENVGPHDVDRILTKYAAGEDAESIVNQSEHQEAA